MGFSNCPSYKKLVALSQTPYDLTKAGALGKQRVEAMQASGASWTLSYATERIDNPTLEALFSLAQEREVLQKMRAMQTGEVMNQIHGYPSEERPVLHTAMRALADARISGARALAARDFAEKEHKKLIPLIEEADRRGIEHIVQVGIGGSDLGPRAIYLALERYRQKREAHFVANVDPDDVASLFTRLDLAKTLIIVVSKSGSTLETQTNEELIRSRYEREGLDPAKYCISVTQKGSPMDDPARYLASFYMQDSVGGRYSVSSMVGCVLLALTLGIEHVRAFLQGAHAMDQVALFSDPKSNLPLLGALLGIWNHNFLGYPTAAVIPYAQALRRLTAHLQQCDMESNGKGIDQKGEWLSFSTGPVVWGEPGTCAQHSFYQWIHQSTDTAPLELLGLRNSQYGEDLHYSGTSSQEKLLANLLAQAIALARGKKDPNPNRTFRGNRPTRILLADQLTPHTMGSLLAYYEHKTAFQGFIWGINSFDQEGVQLGKVLAQDILESMQAKGSKEETIGAYLALLQHS
ncbi:MAG: glucose-6-phosphate isomerase [Chlamydiota bacterium]